MFASFFLGSLTLSKATSCNHGIVTFAFIESGVESILGREVSADADNEIYTCRFLKWFTKALQASKER